MHMHTRVLPHTRTLRSAHMYTPIYAHKHTHTRTHTNEQRWMRPEELRTGDSFAAQLILCGIAVTRRRTILLKLW